MIIAPVCRSGEPTRADFKPVGATRQEIMARLDQVSQDIDRLIISQKNMQGIYRGPTPQLPPPLTYPDYDQGWAEVRRTGKNLTIVRRISPAEVEFYAQQARANGAIFAVAHDDDERTSIGVTDHVFLKPGQKVPNQPMPGFSPAMPAPGSNQPPPPATTSRLQSRVPTPVFPARTLPATRPCCPT